MEKRFKHHTAKLIHSDDNFCIIDWQNEDGSNNDYIRYIVDIQEGSLFINGDLGSCISTWNNPVSVEKMYKYVGNIPYWMGKFQCTSDDYEYAWNDVVTDLNDIKQEYLQDIEYYTFTKEELEEDFEEMKEILDNIPLGDNIPYPNNLVELMEKYNECWWESAFHHIGRRVSRGVFLWSKGFQMACEQLGLI